MRADYQSILVAIDGSKQSEKAFEEAIAIAVINRADLTIAWIINEADLSNSAFSYSKILNEEKELVEKEMLKKIHDAQQAGIEQVESVIELGSPKEYLTKVIPENKKIDLIIMGPTGKGTIQRASVGSTTSYVVNNADCSVLVVR
ncbi:universal stress protein [Enterococcus florum]|uniref:Universal stress protein n=1 Tax=Enterococcus florum TaxID=2480627 RepID=A0A4P5PAM5_9ENTE|nr:universal stress protein [Enterococcus florum]GCF95020.1 universal stress protein [Enterococcus florum]